jgi:hypothetical protein
MYTSIRPERFPPPDPQRDFPDSQGISPDCQKQLLGLRPAIQSSPSTPALPSCVIAIIIPETRTADYSSTQSHIDSLANNRDTLTALAVSCQQKSDPDESIHAAEIAQRKGEIWCIPAQRTNFIASGVNTPGSRYRPVHRLFSPHFQPK